MDNYSRFKSRKIRPSLESLNSGIINPTLEIENTLENLAQNNAKKESNIFTRNLDIISNVRFNAEIWKSFACSRRVKTRISEFDQLFLHEDEIIQQSNSGLGLDDVMPNLLKSNTELIMKNIQSPQTSDQALIFYFATLGQSKNSEETINLDTVHKLLSSGANINCTDRHGQTVMHEVARAWHVDVAKFLINHGADINKGDNFGRTPLHVAAAVDYVEMINILIENKADKEARTIAENQTPVFYAAKTDAGQALRALIINHCCLYKNIVDYRGRTPIQVAAELDRSETARLLLQHEAPVYLSDDHGSKAITWMISKMAPVAREALNQLYSTDRANRKQYFALNHLVCDKKKDSSGKVQTPLHTAVAFKQYDLLMHPVFMHLLDTMWHQFGRFWAIYQLCINFVYILMWTIIGILVEYDKRHIYNLPDDVWRIFLYIFAVAFTIYQITEEIMEFRRSERMHTFNENRRKADIEQDIKFCHPRWPGEKKYLEMEIEILKNQKPKYFHDMWNIFDWICYLMLTICIGTHIADIIAHTELLARLHIRFMTVTIILLWLRLMKNARAFAILGPFIVMLGHMLKDCVRFLFLYMEFYIPYLAAFWMTFGGTKKVQSTLTNDSSNATEEVSVSGFEYPGQIFFSLFRLTLVDDYDYDNMLKIDSVMADILLSTWFLLSAILSLNLFIALLSDTFQRVYDNAQANAVMQRAIMILNIWEGINARRKEKFLLHIENCCSPLRVEYDDDLTEPLDDELKKVTIEIKEELDQMKEMFTLKFGDPRLELYENEFAKTNCGNQKGDVSVNSNFEFRLKTEMNDLRETINSLKKQQDIATSKIQNDMVIIKQMVNQILDNKTAVETKQSQPGNYASSEKSQKKKQKRKSMNVGLEINLIKTGTLESTNLEEGVFNQMLGLSSELFQNTTHSAQSNVFDIILSPSSNVEHSQHKQDSQNGSSC